MFYACHYDVPADEQFYWRVMAEITDEQPQGLVVHLVVKHDGGLRHFEVWNSPADWKRFRQEQVEPALDTVFATAGLGQRPPQPVADEMEVVDVRTGAV